MRWPQATSPYWQHRPETAKFSDFHRRYAGCSCAVDSDMPIASTMSDDLFGGALPAGSEIGGYDASAIEVLEGLEPVRRRPGMYIGGIDERALHHLAAEVLDNSMDEAVAGHANRIEMSLGVGNRLTVSDNGRGIPVDPHPKFPGKSALRKTTARPCALTAACGCVKRPTTNVPGRPMCRPTR